MRDFYACKYEPEEKMEVMELTDNMNQDVLFEIGGCEIILVAHEVDRLIENLTNMRKGKRND